MPTQTRRNKAMNGVWAFRKWIVPYIASRARPGQLRPLLSYLFTEWDCNVQCHYCFSYGAGAPGMTLETAKSSIDWLRSVGCRVVAIMGGEPLLRKDFILEVVRYGHEQGFFVYLPTNGLLMDEQFIEDVSAAGVSAINLAVDCVDPRPGMPKAFRTIEPQFRTLIERQPEFGYVSFLNINITSQNVADVKELTRIADEAGIGADYHLNELPYHEQDDFAHPDNDTYILPEHWREVDELLDWLAARNLRGQPMVNSVGHLKTMKQFMRGELPPWTCRAGQNATCIRVDGSLSPCFRLYGSKQDWGNIWTPRFDHEQLETMKRACMTDCLSTCQYTLGHYYAVAYGIPKWIWKHVATQV